MPVPLRRSSGLRHDEACALATTVRSSVPRTRASRTRCSNTGRALQRRELHSLRSIGHELWGRSACGCDAPAEVLDLLAPEIDVERLDLGCSSERGGALTSTHRTPPRRSSSATHVGPGRTGTVPHGGAGRGAGQRSPPSHREATPSPDDDRIAVLATPRWPRPPAPRVAPGTRPFRTRSGSTHRSATVRSSTPVRTRPRRPASRSRGLATAAAPQSAAGTVVPTLDGHGSDVDERSHRVRRSVPDEHLVLLIYGPPSDASSHGAKSDVTAKVVMAASSSIHPPGDSSFPSRATGFSDRIRSPMVETVGRSGKRSAASQACRRSAGPPRPGSDRASSARGRLLGRRRTGAPEVILHPHDIVDLRSRDLN